jgi:XTP/dITP diphosphohydrolase
VASAPQRPGEVLLELVAVMDRLRSPGGCPWDAEQSHRSLARYLLEETYEVLEALDSGNREHLREELGDLLLQVVFHARVAAEDDASPFDIDDVARGIVDKLVSRHPHVFAAGEVSGAAEVQVRWDELKAAEKQRTSLLDGIPAAMPALARADKVLGRLEHAGLQLEPQEPELAGSFGQRLLALVAEARTAGVDPEAELRQTLTALGERVRRAEGPEGSASEPLAGFDRPDR